MIDLIFTNCNNISKSGVRHWGISDHELIWATKKKKKTVQRFEYKLGRNYIGYNKDNLIEHMKKSEAMSLKCYKVDEIWIHIQTQITHYLDKNCPIRKIKIKQDQDPWIDKHILEWIRKKHKLGKIAANTNSKKGREDYTAEWLEL